MADVKISALPALTTAAPTDLFAVVQGGVTYKGTLTQLVAAIPDATGSTRGLLSSADWTTFNGKLSAAITSLGTAGNGQTGATQTLATGTTGTDFAIVSAADTHTFNLPTASATNRGALSSADWSTFNGKIGAIGTINSVAKAANGAVNSSGSLIMQTADGTNPGLVSTGTQTFAGNKTFTGESSTVGNAFIVNNLGGTAKFTVANAGRVSLTSDTTVTTQTVSVITTDTTNAGLVLRPNGTGAIMASAPDGLTGGNARGQYAVDLQLSKTGGTQVASGNYSVLSGGRNNRASGLNSTVSGGQDNNATAANSSISGGIYGYAYLFGQRAYASDVPGSSGDAQTSTLTFWRVITGTGIQQLTLDGQTPSTQGRAILIIGGIAGANARAWRAQVDVVAIVQTVGNGTVTLGDCFMGSYHVGIKRIGTATSLVGTVDVANEVNDAGMAGAAVTITADDGNEALKIEFTPATNAGTTTVTRVVATAYLTEVGY